MARFANFDPAYQDALAGTVGVIAENVAAAAVAEHGVDAADAHQATGVTLLDQGGVTYGPLPFLTSGTSTAGRLAATNVEAGITEVAGALGMSDAPVTYGPLPWLTSGIGAGKVPHFSKPAAHAAGNVTIADAGGYFASTDVEGALQALGASGGAALPGVVGGYAPLSSGLLVPVGYLGSGTPDGTKFLRDDGTWQVPAAGGGGGGGGLVLLAQLTASASATIDFTTRNAAGQSGALIQSDYDDYLVKFIGIIPATSTSILWMRMGTGAGPTWDAGTAYGSQLFRHSWNASALSGADSGANQIPLTTAWLSTGAHPIAGSLELYDPQHATLYKFVSGKFIYPDSTLGNMAVSEVGGQYNSATAVTAIRFLMSSGNITSGIFRAYGIAKS